jgi:peroxiredoxin
MWLIIKYLVINKTSETMKTKMIFLSIALISTLFYQTNSRGQGVGEVAPDFTLSTLGGSQFNLASKSGKVVFLFLFGYSCPHCLANGNNTEGVYNEFKGNSDFVALGIDTWNGNKAGVQNFVSETGITYPVALNGSDLELSYSTTYDRIIVIDKEGIIRYKSTANATASIVNEAKQVISTLFTTTAVENPQSDKAVFKVYPVPAKETLFIETQFENSKNATVNIIGLNGTIAQSTTYLNNSNSKLSMPVSNLNPGAYILQIITSEQVQYKKIIINK